MILGFLVIRIGPVNRIDQIDHGEIPEHPDSGDLIAVFHAHELVEFLSPPLDNLLKSVSLTTDPLDGMGRPHSAIEFRIAMRPGSEKTVDHRANGGSGSRRIDTDRSVERRMNAG